MMQMTFDVSTSVKLLFDFWDVRGPAGMVLSVFVVFLLTLLFELLKAWRVWLMKNYMLAKRQSEFSTSPPLSGEVEGIYATSSDSAVRQGSLGLDSCSSPSESSLAPMEPAPATQLNVNRWLLHGVQTVLHVLQVTLGYMLMLCVMSYNTWIFLGVIFGSVLGYFIAFPLLGSMVQPGMHRD